ncbi:MAG: cytochrome c oxidase subunit II [Sphingomonadales bacterium]
MRIASTAFLGVVVSLGSVFAQDGRLGVPADKKINFQDPATDIMENIINLHETIFWIITAIVILVLGLMVWIVVRYNRKTNPKPSKTTHHTGLEIIWTIIPVIILTFIGYESLKLLYKQDVIPEADMVISATGSQWYWTYDYPEEGLSFDANMVPSAYTLGEATGDEKEDWDNRLEELRILLGRTEPIVTRRLLDTDTRVVVPVDTTVKVLVTASDVLHAWTIPAFGFKIDAVPGRTNETWFHAREIGTFYGQCSELCGIKHAFMPIVVEVVSREDYESWVVRAKYFQDTGNFPTAPEVADNANDPLGGQ